MRVGIIAKLLGAPIILAFCMSQAVGAPCVAPPASPEAIAQFKANPQALVAPGSDTRTIEGIVRDLAGTDANLAVDLVHVAENAPPRFQTAIAAGLAQAAVACTNLDQQAGLQIQQAVASFQDGQFQASFEAVAGDLSTASVNAATESAASSVGSVIIVNPTSNARATTNPGGGGASTALALIASNPATINNTNTANQPTSPSTTAASPVSQTR